MQLNDFITLYHIDFRFGISIYPFVGIAIPDYGVLNVVGTALHDNVNQALVTRAIWPGPFGPFTARRPRATIVHGVEEFLQ